ncbi:putative ATP-dependent helicase DinG [compost metagenome]
MTTPTPLDRAHAWVDAAYSAMSRNPNFVLREQQVDLSKAVSEAFLSGKPLAAEAPTGTGKTIAYLIGALAATEVLQAANPTPIPVVVSTATKALQSQLFEKDLPVLVATGLLERHHVALAKGKGNYLCLTEAEEIRDLLGNADQETFLDEGAAQMDFEQVASMVDAFRDRKWDGDFDTWKGQRPANVRTIAVNNETCTGKKCANYSSCAYFRARNKLGDSRIIVANHDLVLLDMLMAAEAEVGSLPVANYYIVFDEGHHLPEKALRIGTAEGNLGSLLRSLPKLTGMQRIIKGSPELAGRLAAYKVDESLFDRRLLAGELEQVMETLSGIDVDKETFQYRFAGGKVPKDLEDALLALQTPLGKLMLDISTAIVALKEVTSELPPPVQEKANELMRRCLDVRAPSKALLDCIGMLVSPGRRVKWLYRKDEAMTLHCSPMEGADVLKPLLWTGSRTKGVAIVSATLRDIGGFERFKSRAGMPESTQTMVLPYTFPYRESKLVVAGMSATPKLAERKAFLAELALKLPSDINPKEGTLVLFPSWAILREFVPKLRRHFGDDAVLVQGEHVMPVLRELHETRVKAGKGSILVGAATLAEGLDLPGKLCEHVIIISLPFAVPTDPVEQELQEMLGKDYFSRRSLPDAMVRLVQMVGRLIRRESDRGRVTIYDRRLASTSYGRKMLEQLPPFEKIIEKLAA